MTIEQAANAWRILYELWGEQHGLKLVEFEVKEVAPARAGISDEGKKRQAQYESRLCVFYHRSGGKDKAK